MIDAAYMGIPILCSDAHLAKEFIGKNEEALYDKMIVRIFKII